MKMQKDDANRPTTVGGLTESRKHKLGNLTFGCGNRGSRNANEPHEISLKS